MKQPTKEKPWKQFCCEQAYKLGIKPNSFRVSIARGKHPAPKIRKVNQRVWFVVCEQ